MSIDTARARHERGMIDACTITRRATARAAYDETTGATTPPAATTVYAGKCLVTRLTSVPREQSKGGELEYIDRAKVSVPHDAGPFQIGDLVTVTAATNDADLVGQEARVTSIITASLTARRQLHCDITRTGIR